MNTYRKLSIALALMSIALTSTSGQWRYHDEKDPMTGKTASNATIESDNSLSLNFPYQGRNKGTLHVRKHPQYGTDVLLQIDKGQLLCHSYDPCTIKVRFDDKPAINFQGTPPADHDSTVAFLSPAGKFIALAKKSTQILVQATIYQAGNQVLTFKSPVELIWTSK